MSQRPLSPDGQWEWDGQQWVPRTQPTAPAPKRRSSRRILWLGLGLVVLIVFGVCVAAVSNSGNKSQTKTASKPPAQAEPVTLLELQGSGIKNSDPFDAPAQWKIAYSYDCSKFGAKGNFIVTVYDGQTPVDVAANEIGPGGSGSSAVYHAGKVHLQMNSECAWSVKATK